MKSYEMFPGNYLKGDEIKGRTIRLVVDRYEIEKLQDGEMKPVLYFKRAKKGLVLNKTNADVLFSMRPDADEWKGLEVEMYFDPNVSFAGKRTGGIRLRSVDGPSQEEPPPPEEEPEMLDEDENPFD